MSVPRMTTRRWMAAVAATAITLAVLPRLHCDRSEHPYYWANKAAASRRRERWARHGLAASRKFADEFHRLARSSSGSDRERHEQTARQHEEEARSFEEWAEGAARDAKKFSRCP